MGSQQQFCLRWNNHQLNMLGVFDQLLQSEALVDVTIACEGLSLKAHKVVLSACSPFFQSLFLENPCKHPIVILKDIKFSDLKALIDFMYRGEVNVSQEQLSALLQTAETLKVKGLAEVTGGLGEVPAENGIGNILSTESLSTSDEHNAQRQLPTLPSGEDSNSPPSKRKKIRSRRRSGGSSNHSDKEDEDLQNPLEVVETKVEIADEDYECPHSISMQEMQASQSTPQNVESSLNLSTQSQSNSVSPVNKSFTSSGSMEVIPCPSSGNITATSSLNRTTHMPPPIMPSQTNLPALSVPSMPSTSGSQSSGQDLLATFLWGKDRRSFPFRGKESVRLAVEAVLKDNISFREAARRYGVNHSTVYNHVKFARMRHARMYGKPSTVHHQKAPSQL